MKKIGFTLAEVLIVLTVLGVIAAITMPALTTNIQKQEWVQGLKTNYYDLQQGFARMLADQDISDMKDSEIWTKYVNSEGNYTPSEETLDGIKQDFAKYFKFNDIVTSYPSNYKPLDYTGTNLKDGVLMTQNNALIFNMANSALVVMIINKSDHGIASVVIDVNGYKGPNKASKDLFLAYLQDDGTLTAAGVNEYWKTTPVDKCTDESFKSNSVETGWYCTGRIIDEGWKMNY